jgi:hypothetical protein
MRSSKITKETTEAAHMGHGDNAIRGKGLDGSGGAAGFQDLGANGTTGDVTTTRATVDKPATSFTKAHESGIVRDAFKRLPLFSWILAGCTPPRPPVAPDAILTMSRLPSTIREKLFWFHQYHDSLSCSDLESSKDPELSWENIRKYLGEPYRKSPSCSGIIEYFKVGDDFVNVSRGDIFNEISQNNDRRKSIFKALEFSPNGQFGFEASYLEAKISGRTDLADIDNRVFQGTKGRNTEFHGGRLIEMVPAGQNNARMVFTHKAEFIMDYDALLAEDGIKRELGITETKTSLQYGDVVTEYRMNGKEISRFEACLAIQAKVFFRHYPYDIRAQEKFNGFGYIPLSIRGATDDGLRTVLSVFDKNTGTIKRIEIPRKHPEKDPPADLRYRLFQLDTDAKPGLYWHSNDSKTVSFKELSEYYWDLPSDDEPRYAHISYFERFDKLPLVFENLPKARQDEIMQTFVRLNKDDGIYGIEESYEEARLNGRSELRELNKDPVLSASLKNATTAIVAKQRDFPGVSIIEASQTNSSGSMPVMAFTTQGQMIIDYNLLLQETAIIKKLGITPYPINSNGRTELLFKRGATLYSMFDAMLLVQTYSFGTRNHLGDGACRYFENEGLVPLVSGAIANDGTSIEYKVYNKRKGAIETISVPIAASVSSHRKK